MTYIINIVQPCLKCNVALSPVQLWLQRVAQKKSDTGLTGDQWKKYLATDDFIYRESSGCRSSCASAVQLLLFHHGCMFHQAPVNAERLLATNGHL